MNQTHVIVGMASCGLAAGAQETYDVLSSALSDGGVRADLGLSGCVGVCFLEPIVKVIDPDGTEWTYGNVTPARAETIIEQHIVGGEPILEWTFEQGESADAYRSYTGKQVKIVMRNCGKINPEDIDEYLARDGYKAIEKVVTSMTCEEVIGEISGSGLRGRGGAGFPTGRKWQFAFGVPSDVKYIICNADEGDPGAFMNRTVLESDPHSMLEGLMIGGYAIGAKQGFIYARAEYPLAIKRLRIAIAQARERGFLGENLFGTDFSFDIEIRQGAGAFVCGEETALIASIEGKRGMPKLRPPYPATEGLFGKPTIINNVGTLTNIPWIILNGAEAFAQYGTEKSKGTKVFSLAGKIARGGSVEVPMGITLDEMIHDIGGGSNTGKPVKAVQMGGPSGGCVPASLFDTRVDYEELTSTGAIMGSGGAVVMDDETCMVDIARFFLNFTQTESCGKCTYCRVGTRRMLEILSKICDGEGTMEDLDTLRELAEKVKNTALCGLGNTAPNPVLTTLKYFQDEYVAHVRDKACPAKVCKALITYSIDPEACTGCGACVRACPVNAIAGERKEVHEIDPALCTKCGSCYEVCTFDAITVD
ncbi:MAG: NADH-ubiquinone oxidoreductase-F iron-sulfur binding region domain-containing protein [Anaerolineae bacterium]|jgi:NADH-quinone oxidoreductase subunit F